MAQDTIWRRPMRRSRCDLPIDAVDAVCGPRQGFLATGTPLAPGPKIVCFPNNSKQVLLESGSRIGTGHNLETTNAQISSRSTKDLPIDAVCSLMPRFPVSGTSPSPRAQDRAFSLKVEEFRARKLKQTWPRRQRGDH